MTSAPKKGFDNGSAPARAASLEAVAKSARAAAEGGAEGGAVGRRPLPPVHLWNPPYCGDLDIRIARDGLWHYLGTPIGREPLVRLFASVLRRDDDDKYYLVTPVEKIGITVEDVPFIAVDFRAGTGADGAPILTFETNVGDETTAGPDAPIRIERDPETGEPTPYVLVRARLEARIDRKTFYRLVDLGEVAQTEEGEMFGVWSGGVFFALASAEEVGMTLSGAEREA